VTDHYVDIWVHNDLANILPNGRTNCKGDFMSFDMHAKSADLLEKLANSVYDRDPTNPKPLFFSLTEIQLVESWLLDNFGEEIKKPVSI
jgi:hypothetical protein